MEVLISTWQGGGATQPAFGIGRMLAERGHRVRILGPAIYEGRALAAGCEHRSIPAEAEFDVSGGRSAEEQDEYSFETMLGTALPEALAAELAARPADAIVVDYLLRSTICRAELDPSAHFILVHMLHRWYGHPHGGDEPWGWRWQYEKVNDFRQGIGLGTLPIGPNPSAIALMERAAGTLVAMPREFDDWGGDEIDNLHHLGPIFEEAPSASWSLPWPPEDRRPLAVVSMGSTYMHQEGVLRRIADALSGLEVRALLLSGMELDPDEVELPPEVEVRSYVPHSAVLPAASLVITHAGIGTLMASFAAGVPILCLPLGRDQGENAERLLELGAGAVLHPGADVDEIRGAIDEALGSETLQQGSARMAEAVAAYSGGAEVVDVIEAAA